MFSKGDKVTFTPEFSTRLAGVEFEVDNAAVRTDSESGREFIGVRTKVGTRWAHRIAWVDTLVAL